MTKRHTLSSSKGWLAQPLSHHQAAILQCYLAGWEAEAIRLKFNISLSTVHSTLNQVQDKFNAPNRRIMTMLALYDGLFTLPELLPLTIAAMNTQFLADLPERTTGGPRSTTRLRLRRGFE